MEGLLLCRTNKEEEKEQINSWWKLSCAGTHLSVATWISKEAALRHKKDEEELNHRKHVEVVKVELSENESKMTEQCFCTVYDCFGVLFRGLITLCIVCKSAPICDQCIAMGLNKCEECR